MLTTTNFSAAGVGNFNVVIYTPDNTTGDLPAFIFFPGSGESGSDSSKLYINGPLKFIKAGWKPNFIVVGVQTNVTWGPDPGLPPTFVKAAIDQLLDGTHRIDKNKFYLTGLSNGCAYSMRYLQGQSDVGFHQPAAAILFSMNMWAQKGLANDTSKIDPSTTDIRFSKIGMWGFCGKSDNFYDTESLFFSQLIAAKYPAKFTPYAGGHGGWNTFYDPNYKEAGQSIYDWALGFTANTSTTPVVTPPPVVTDPAPVTKTIKSVLVTYSDGTTQTLPG